MGRVIFRKAFWSAIAILLLISIGCYCWLSLSYPIIPSLEDPRASWASMIGADSWQPVLHILCYLVATLAYLGILWLLWKNRQAPQVRSTWLVSVILLAWLACSGVLFTMAPAGESHDIFDYIFRGRMITVYHSNPLADIPDAYGTAIPYTRYLAWRTNVDTYGPVWEISSAAVSAGVRLFSQWTHQWDQGAPVCPASPASCRLLLGYITGYRLLAVFLTGLSGGVIAALVSRPKPDLVPLSLAAWLLNPMTLIATAVGAHNDAVMLVLILLGCWCLQRGKPFWGLMAFILAAHVKLTALIWFPAGVFWILRRWGWKYCLKVCLLSGISGLDLSWVLYTPFGGWQTLPRMLDERAIYLANSIWLLPKYVLDNIYHWPYGYVHRVSVDLPTYLFIIGVVIIPLWRLRLLPKRWRHVVSLTEDTDRELWTTMLAVSLFYLAVGSYWFQHWYILWLIFPAVLLPDRSFTRILLPWLVFGALCSNLLTSVFLGSIFKSTPAIWGYLASWVMIWLPFTIATILALNQRRRYARLVASV